MFTPEKIDVVRRKLENTPPEDALRWAWDTFGDKVGATSSFQTQSVALLHMISRVAPEMPIYFLDTGFHFPETLGFRDFLTRELKLNMKTISPEMGHDHFRVEHGDLYRRDPDMCCYINKVEPLAAVMKGMKGWISGIRSDQTAERASSSVVSLQKDGIVKVCPLLRWTSRDIGMYLVKHGLPDHPLLVQGYVSIGCAPCTRPVFEGQDDRSGRWAGHTKKECGLHVESAWEKRS